MTVIPAVGREEEGRRSGEEERGTAGQGAGAPLLHLAGRGRICRKRMEENGENRRRKKGEMGEDDAWNHCVSVLFFEIMRLYYSETRLQSLIAFSSKDAGKASFHKHSGIDNGSNFTQ
jgi:hypothetical protein